MSFHSTEASTDSQKPVPLMVGLVIWDGQLLALFPLPMILLQMGGGSVDKLCPILVTPCTVPHQAPLSMGFPRQEYWS